ncbi:MAG: hypothetical protein BroJett018_02290 [Chloroflexota bacterium]|nr:hypothetical protein [Chloroflexota bacterium]NOG61978.1 hypothetical protein [Chloroflexota bacterium]GIK62435.1 MAG: hypothetical protein BroJett018_02290 [Chloroflexota bacterium]
MNRELVFSMFQVDEAGIIRTPGPFEGQYLYIPYFWYLHISGYREDVRDGIITFQIRMEDHAQFPELANQDVVRLKQQENGMIVEISEFTS